MVDTNGDGDVGKLQVIKYIETRTHIDKPDYIERANEYFEQEIGIKKSVFGHSGIISFLKSLHKQ